MPTQEQLYTALRNADAAGDVESARKIAAYIRTGQRQETPSNTAVALSGMNNGAAAMIDSVADIGPNVMNLAKAAVGFPLAAAGRVDLAE